MNLQAIQHALQQAGLDGWLFFDHHGRDPLAYRILGLSLTRMATRRWYYFVPADGEPQKLVHRIESGNLDDLPGTKNLYSSWREQQSQLCTLLPRGKKIALQYSPDCAIPYVSLVDGGTLELVCGCGVDVVSSADLVQQFEACWTDEQFEMHLEAGRRVDKVRAEAFHHVAERLKNGMDVDEFGAQQFIRRRFTEEGLWTDHGPIVAVNANASDPHYEPSRDRSSPIKPGDLLLIDMWAKLDKPHAVFYDITWTAFCGKNVPDAMAKVFDVVSGARKKASAFAIERAQTGVSFAGFEVDDIARGHIDAQGYGQFFIHRTGHSIGTEVHGTGANMDNLESHDDRTVIARTCFSVEPGIYLPEFGIRSEVNVYVGPKTAQVTGEQQYEMLTLLA